MQLWTACTDELAAAGERLVSLLQARGGIDTDADLAVAMLGSVMNSYLNVVFGEPDHPMFMPFAGFYTHIGTPNPDCMYKNARIDGTGTYELTGFRGTAPQVSIMPFGSPTSAGQRTFAPFDLDDLTLDADGRFRVLMSEQRPDGHTGDWWPLDHEMQTLMLRSVSDDWGNHRDPLVAITRLDTPPRRTAPTDDAVRARIAAIARMVEGSIGYGIRRVDQLTAEGVVNALTGVDFSNNGGLPNQWYQEGVFDLDVDTALLLETKLPEGCEYLSLSLTDRLFCTIEWTGAQSSLNTRQVIVDDDGTLRVVVASRDPEVHNWLDTTGLLRGVMQFRWAGSAVPPEVSLRLVALGAVHDELPPGTHRVTAEERAATLRARHAAAQLRSLW